MFNKSNDPGSISANYDTKNRSPYNQHLRALLLYAKILRTKYLLRFFCAANSRRVCMVILQRNKKVNQEISSRWTLWPLVFGGECRVT